MSMDQKTILIIIHVFGAVIGAGGAYMSDLLFLKAARDEVISKTEIGFLKLGGKIGWFGLFILVLSGTGLFLLDTEKYLASPKFLVKMTIVAVLIINGIIFHATHIPRMARHAGQHFPSSDEFMRKRPLLLLSGCVSIISWSAALILGMLKSIPYSYETTMLLYAAAVGLAFLGAFTLKNKLVPGRKRQ